jgi:hypothetical protein
MCDFVIWECQDLGTSAGSDVAILTILSVLPVLPPPDIARQFTVQALFLQSFTAIHALTGEERRRNLAQLVPRLR